MLSEIHTKREYKIGGIHFIIFAIGLVLLSGLVHSIWNLFAKNSINKIVFLWYCQIAAIIIFLPFVLVELDRLQNIPMVGWGLIVISMILHGLYVLLLARTYSIGDLSQAYPIMRGTSPLLVPLIGVTFLHEQLTIMGWVGVVIIVLGIMIIGNLKRISFLDNKVVILAFSVGIMITSYTVVDKLSLRYFSPVMLNEATNIGNLMALTWLAVKSRELLNEWKVNWRTIILGGLLAPGGYILFLFSLQIMPLSQIAPMREIGTVFGTILGVFVLHEQQGKTRIFASVLITLGVILLSNLLI